MIYSSNPLRVDIEAVFRFFDMTNHTAVSVLAYTPFCMCGSMSAQSILRSGIAGKRMYPSVILVEVARTLSRK